jgi:hypothetical protein
MWKRPVSLPKVHGPIIALPQKPGDNIRLEGTFGIEQ